MNTTSITIRPKNNYSDELDLKIDRIVEAKKESLITSREARFLIFILLKKELRDSLDYYFEKEEDSRKSKGSVFLLNYLQKTTQ